MRYVAVILDWAMDFFTEHVFGCLMAGVVLAAIALVIAPYIFHK